LSVDFPDSILTGGQVSIGTKKQKVRNED
jgi:hypothetical protein